MSTSAAADIADNRRFWLGCNLVLLILHVLGVFFYVRDGFEQPLAQLWAIVVAIHILELPLAYLLLRARHMAWGTTLILTLLFGFTWWVPTRRRVYHD